VSDNLAAELTAHFGPDGLRGLGVAPAGPLREPGLPRQVGRYFTAPVPSDPLSLGEYAGMWGGSAGEAAGQLRIGTDGGAQLYFAPDRSVRAVVLGTNLPEMAVNASVEAFAESLLRLDAHLGRATEWAGQDAAFEDYLGLRRALIAIDPEAFAERESWWPRVLDDLRLPLNVLSAAAFEYVDAQGGKQIVSEQTEPGLPHPEELVWHRLQAAGVEPEQVTKVYCELKPCLLPGHYCAIWMQQAFPQAEFTHRFDFGSTAESREDAVRALMLSVADADG
jgi:hypothetical protein